VKYLEDRDTGVTVEDSPIGGPYLRVVGPDDRGASKGLYPNRVEADAILRGLLRWKLENGDGGDLQRAADLDQWVNGESQEWIDARKERSR